MASRGVSKGNGDAYRLRWSICAIASSAEVRGTVLRTLLLSSLSVTVCEFRKGSAACASTGRHSQLAPTGTRRLLAAHHRQRVHGLSAWLSPVIASLLYIYMHQGMQQNISLSRCMQMTGPSHSQQSAIGRSAVQQGRSLLHARRGKGSQEQIGMRWSLTPSTICSGTLSCFQSSWMPRRFLIRLKVQSREMSTKPCMTSLHKTEMSILGATVLR